MPNYVNIYDVFKTRYSFLSVKLDEDFTSKTDLINSLKSSSFVQSNILPSNLNLSAVTVIVVSSTHTNLIIYSSKEPNKGFVFTIEGEDYTKLVDQKYIVNDVNIRGTGWITIVSLKETWSDEFKDGIRVNSTPSPSLRRSCFKECFERGYNTICDDVVGCVAWYSNVGVPLMVAGVCSFQCNFN